MRLIGKYTHPDDMVETPSGPVPASQVNPYCNEQAVKGGQGELLSGLTALSVKALENHPGFFSDLYMSGEFGNKHRAPFSTPWNICKMMADMQIGTKESMQEIIEKNGYIRVADPAVGGAPW